MVTTFFGGAFYDAGFFEEIPQGGVFFYGDFFDGDFFIEYPDRPSVIQEGGSGGSNKAGKGAKKKKKHEWERRGHVISAIQSGAYLSAYDLPEETTQEIKQTSVVEEYIVENDLQITSLEVLLATVTAALKSLEVDEQSREEKNRLRLEAHTYKLKVREDYQRKQVRRRRDEEALLQILLHL